MTSVMQRPRSTQPIDQQHYHDDSRTHQRSTSSSQHQMHLLSEEYLPPASALGTSELEDQLADLQRELLGQSSNAAAAASSTQMARPGDLNVLGGSMGDNLGDLDIGPFGGLEEGGPSSSMNLLDDPSVLALVGQSSNMESTDFDLNLASQALSSQFVDSASGQYSDLNLTSAGTFQFPEFPASLLDQAPEYEYSVHTQANVFDAVHHQFDAAGEDEAARLFSLDHYDPSLLQVNQSSVVGGGTDGEDVWNYQSASGVGFGQGQMSDYATFHDSSSLSEYPEPSTAPTSRASDYKQDPITGEFYSTPQHSFAIPASHYPLKRRRESLDVSLTPAQSGNVQLHAGYGRPVEMQGYHQEQFYPVQQVGQYGYVDERQHPMVPSQGVNARARMSSWNGEGTGHYVDDWPPPPPPAPMNGQRQMMYQQEVSHQHNAGNNTAASSQVYVTPTLSSGPNMMNNAMAARLSSSSSDASGPSNFANSGGPHHPRPHLHNRSKSPSSMAAAARTASHNEMINALGNAMDASMESEGVAKCPYPNCTKTFAKNRSYNLKAHLRSHSQLKPFACNHCPRAFSRKHDLERHARVHSGDKPYLCEACGKGFPRSDALRRHWRVEKECGDKAVEIEAGQPLPSLPPGVSTIAAQAKGPVPGMTQLHTTSSATPMSISSHPMLYSSFPSTNWEGNGYAYQQSDRKRAREDY
ncbi:hypothetical protein CBS101457_005903 [Exobasidium rhododendri]|nr:hypothetical protein CBS101457_005903 [Exobasidium rhododendri]